MHNRRLHGAWVFTSTGGGASLWEGLGEIENPYGYVLDDSAANHQLIPRGYGWASIDGSAFLTREYLKAWRDHPAFVLRVVASRMVRILTQSDRLQPLFFGRVREWLDAFGLITLAAAVWLARRNRLAVLLLIVLPMYALISIGLVHFEPRYVRYVEVAYVLGAAIVCSRLASVALERWPRATLAVVVLFCLAGSVYTVRELVAVRAAALAGVEQP